MTESQTRPDIFETNQWLRLAGILGMLFVVVFIVQMFVVPQAPDYNADTSAILSYYTEHQTGIELGAWLLGVFNLLYGVFLAGLWGALQRSKATWLATLGLAAGVGNMAVLFGGHAINVALANDVVSRYSSDVGLITALFKVASLLTLVFNTWTDGLSILAFSVAMLLSGVFVGWVRWIAWLGVLSGIGFTISTLTIFNPAQPLLIADLAAGLAWLIWIIGLSVYLLIHPNAATTAGRTSAATASSTPVATA